MPLAHDGCVAGDAQWTLSEATHILNPAITQTQLRQIIAALAWQPAGKRYTGRRGGQENTYHAPDIMRLHAALTPWLPSATGPSYDECHATHPRIRGHDA